MIDIAKQKHTALMVELSLREDNYCIGSGLGGNPNILFKLLGKEHKFETSVADLEIQNYCVVWNPDWLAANDSKSIRLMLDEKFKSINSLNYIDFEYLSNGTVANIEWYQTNSKYKSIADDILNGKNIAVDELSQVAKVIIFAIVFKTISDDIDSRGTDMACTKFPDVYSKVDNACKAILNVESTIILFVLRKVVGLSRMIISNMDDHPSASKLLDKVVNDIE